jgi:integrase
MAKIAKRRGKWVVDWYDPVTKRRSREVCINRDAAKRRLGEVLKAGERIGLKSTVKEYGDKWLEHMKDELASSTYQEYSAVLRNHVYPVLGEKPFTGIRQGELIALKASDVDFKNRLIHVQRNLSRGKLKLPKNGKTRKVDMSKQLAGVLQELNRGPD